MPRIVVKSREKIYKGAKSRGNRRKKKLEVILNH